VSQGCALQAHTLEIGVSRGDQVRGNTTFLENRYMQNKVASNPHCGKTGIPVQASIYSTPIKVAGLQLLTRQRGLEAENAFLQPSGKFEVGRWA
jgi:hypothetical protein